MRTASILISAVVLSSALVNCSERAKTPADPEILAREILADPESRYKEKLACMDTEKAVRAQLKLGSEFEQQAKLAYAYYWYRTAEEHGSRPGSLYTQAHELYRYARTEDRETGEGLLAFHSSPAAAPWQSLVGDDYELSDIGEAEKWWDLAAGNGYKGKRNKHHILLAWPCRHWLLLLCMLAAGTAVYRLRGKSEPRVPQSPAPPCSAHPTKPAGAFPPGAVPPVNTVPLKRFAGKNAKVIFPVPAGKQ